MDKASLLARIEAEDSFLKRGEQLIERQTRLVADMQKRGVACEGALSILDTYRRSQAIHSTDRERWRALLARVVTAETVE